MLLWLYLSGVERRLCCSGSTYLAWRGGCVALALSIWRGEEVVLLWLYLEDVVALSVWHGEEVVLLWLYLYGVRGGCVALALSVWRCLEAAWHPPGSTFSHMFTLYLLFFVIWIVYVVFSLCCYSVHTTSIARLSILEGGSLLCCSSWGF